jgi:hypothetical protein
MNRFGVVSGSVWPLSGLAFVVAAGSGILFSMILPPEPYPSPFGAPLGPQTDVATFFREARPQVELMSFLYAIAGIFLIVFVAEIAGRIARTRDAQDARPLGALALGGGMLAAGFWLLSAMLLWVLARPWTPEQPNLVRAFHDLTYLVGGPAHVLTLGLFAAAGAVALPRDGIPSGIRWAGLGGALVALLSVVALLVDPATLLLPIGRGLIMLWIAGISVGLAWTSWRTETPTVRRSPSAVAGARG